jgi:hypothetical protein
MGEENRMVTCVEDRDRRRSNGRAIMSHACGRLGRTWLSAAVAVLLMLIMFVILDGGSRVSELNSPPVLQKTVLKDK